MPIRQLADAPAQSNTASGAAITAAATSATLQSASGFPAILAGGQLSVTILDGGNPAWNPAAPLATPFEYQQVNGIAGNVLTFGPGGGGAQRLAYAGTTPKSFFGGSVGPPPLCPIIAVGLLAEDLIASTEWKFDEQSPSGTGTVTIPASGSIPASYLGINWRHLEIEILGRSSVAAINDIVNIRFNGDTGNNYFWSNLVATTATPAATVPTQATAGIAGVITAASASATVPGMVRIWVPEFASTTFAKVWLASMGYQSGGTGMELGQFQGNWNQTTALVSVTLFLTSGQWIAGSRIITRLKP